MGLGGLDFTRVFDPNVKQGRGSGWADILSGIADYGSAMNAADERKKAQLMQKMDLARVVYGDDMARWPKEVLGAMKDTFGVFGEASAPLAVKQKAKKETYTETTQRAKPAEEATPDMKASLGMDSGGAGLINKTWSERQQGAGRVLDKPEAAPFDPTRLDRKPAGIEMEDVTETKTREVAQPDLMLPTSQEVDVNGEKLYIPVKDPRAGLTVGMIADSVGAVLPPGFNRDLTMREMQAIGLDPMTVFQQKPTMADMMNNSYKALDLRMSAMQGDNPSVMLEANGVYNQSYTAMREAYGQEAVNFLPPPASDRDMIANWAAGQSGKYIAPPQRMATALQLGEAMDKRLLQTAQMFGPQAAIDMINSVSTLLDPSDPTLSLIPMYQIEDVQLPMKDSTGKPILNADGSPKMQVTPGLRTLLTQQFGLGQLGIAVEQAKGAYTLTELGAKISGLRRSGGGGTRGGTGSGTGGGGDITGTLTGALKGSDARMLTNIMAKGYHDALEGIGIYPGVEPTAEQAAQRNALRDDFAQSLADQIRWWGEPTTFAQLQPVVGYDEAQRLIAAAKTKKPSGKPAPASEQEAAEAVLSGYGA